MKNEVLLSSIYIKVLKSSYVLRLENEFLNSSKLRNLNENMWFWKSENSLGENVGHSALSHVRGVWWCTGKQKNWSPPSWRWQQSRVRLKSSTPWLKDKGRTRTLTRTKGPTKGIHFLKSLIGSLKIIDC